ncbi:MAG: serine hydrolase domain-containing protein [Candidatus Hermodarchaeota archaeon]
MSPKLSKKLLAVLIIVPLIFSVGFVSLVVIINLPRQTQGYSLESQIRNFMSNAQIPSLGACIIVNDTVIWAQGFGDQSELDTVYMIGSITKSFTATAILQLYENNSLDLDDNIEDFLPFTVKHPDYPSRNVTIEMLLTHTAGLSTNLYWSLEYYFNNETITWINDHFGWDIVVWDDRPSLGDFLNESLNPTGAYYDDYNWQSRPGSEYRYSNAGYQLLGYLIEEITNQSIMDYMQENIFDPLNMSNSGYFYEDFLAQHAIPYEWNNSIVEYPLYNINVTGAGSIHSTIPDMARYITAQMNNGICNGTQILDSTSVSMMQSIQTPLAGTTVEGFNLAGYGFGWNIYLGGYKGHGGATPGFSSNTFFKKDSDSTLGVIIMFNRGSALLYDETLLTNHIPTINGLLLEEAEALFQQALSS